MLEGKTVLGLICARGGSKGIPRKNILPLGGKPLIAWSISIGKECGYIDRLVVSTDDEKIAEVAAAYDAEVPFLRPAELAQDNSPEWSVWQHCLYTLKEKDGFRPDYLAVLPPTSPFRSIEDVQNGLKLLHRGDADIIITVTRASRNPYFNMVELDDRGFAQLSKKPHDSVIRRQDAPIVYDMTTVLYAAQSSYVTKSKGTFQGRVLPLVVPGIRAVDIDTEMDLAFAEFLLAEKRI